MASGSTTRGTAEGSSSAPRTALSTTGSLPLGGRRGEVSSPSPTSTSSAAFGSRESSRRSLSLSITPSLPGRTPTSEVLWSSSLPEADLAGLYSFRLNTGWICTKLKSLCSLTSIEQCHQILAENEQGGMNYRAVARAHCTATACMKQYA